MKQSSHTMDNLILHTTLFLYMVLSIEHIIKPALGQIKYVPGENITFTLTLHPSLIYNIAFADPHYSVLSIHPTAIPTSKVALGPNSGVNLLYLKVSYVQCL